MISDLAQQAEVIHAVYIANRPPLICLASFRPHLLGEGGLLGLSRRGGAASWRRFSGKVLAAAVAITRVVALLLCRWWMVLPFVGTASVLSPLSKRGVPCGVRCRAWKRDAIREDGPEIKKTSNVINLSYDTVSRNDDLVFTFWLSNRTPFPKSITLRESVWSDAHATTYRLYIFIVIIQCFWETSGENMKPRLVCDNTQQISCI